MIVRYNRRAVRDLFEIADYVRTHSPASAERVKTRIEGLINGLSDFPHQGSPTDEPEIRRLVATPYPYLIFYRIKSGTVIILHIRHGRRKAERIAPR